MEHLARTNDPLEIRAPPELPTTHWPRRAPPFRHAPWFSPTGCHQECSTAVALCPSRHIYSLGAPPSREHTTWARVGLSHSPRIQSPGIPAPPCSRLPRLRSASFRLRAAAIANQH